jgi:hypothetical protein
LKGEWNGVEPIARPDSAGGEAARPGNPIDDLAVATVGLVLALEASAAMLGQKLDPAVIFHGGAELMEQLADIAKAANIHDFSDDEMTGAANRAAMLYGVSSKTMDKQEALAEFDHFLKTQGDQLGQSLGAAAQQGGEEQQVQAKALADYETQARINHTTPDHYEKTTDGRIVIWNKDGSTRGALGPDGQFIPSGESISESDDGGVTGTVSGERASRTGSSSTAAPKPSAAKKAPDGNKGSALSQLAKLPPPPGGRVGATATGPNGLKATWNGKMWVLADVNG